MSKYGIVILNYQKYELTSDCVRNLVSKGIKAKILIVDNCSTNDSYNLLSREFEDVINIEVIKNKENTGYARGNNFGIDYLKSWDTSIEYFCIMNPDVEIRYADIFDNLISKLELDKKYACATGLMITNGQLDLNSCYWRVPRKSEIAYGHSVLYRRKNNKLLCDENGVACVEAVPGSFFIIKRSVYEKLQGFDEGTFLYNEENILAKQLRDLGYVNIISIQDCYNHNHPKGERQKLKQKLTSRKVGNQSRRYLCKKYYSHIDRFLLEIVIFTNIVVISFKHLGGNIQRNISKRRDRK